MSTIITSSLPGHLLGIGGDSIGWNDLTASSARSSATRRPRRPTSSPLRTLAGVSLVLAAASAIVTATIDAASVAGRISGQVIESRPIWLHTFSIALVTMAVTVFALWGGRSAVTVQARVVYMVTAALNLSVLLLRQGHPDFRFVLPAVHVVLAALLLSLSLLAQRHAS